MADAPERSGGPGRPDHARAFYGRRVGKQLKPAQSSAIEVHLDRLRVALDAPPPSPLTGLFDAPVSAVRVEIGFGGGEHLLQRARERPDVGFIGVEPFINGMAKLLRAIEHEPLPNLRVHDDDAVQVLNWLPDGSVDHVDLLYPDPWRKTRHHKRRFVGPANLDRITRVLRPGGTCHFASDWADYVNWTLAQVRAHGALKWRAGGPSDWREPFEGWPGTRYEAKALREGRVPAYLRFQKPGGDAPRG